MTRPRQKSAIVVKATFLHVIHVSVEPYRAFVHKSKTSANVALKCAICRPSNNHHHIKYLNQIDA